MAHSPKCQHKDNKMSMSMDEARDLYKDCNGCERNTCTEDNDTVFDRGEVYCCQECLDLFLADEKDHIETQESLDRWVLTGR